MKSQAIRPIPELLWASCAVYVSSGIESQGSISAYAHYGWFAWIYLGVFCVTLIFALKRALRTEAKYVQVARVLMLFAVITALALSWSTVLGRLAILLIGVVNFFMPMRRINTSASVSD